MLTVARVRLSGRTLRTRERAGIVLLPDRLPPRRPGGQPGANPPAEADLLREGRLAVGDRLRLRAVAVARWSDPLGRRPPVVLRHPVVEAWAPPPGVVLRVSEVVRDAARRRALGSLAPERAGLLVGMALGDTSLLPAELEHDFRAAGLTHLMAVSGSIAG